MALDSVLLSLKAQNKIPNTLRFLSFNPECILIGYHQNPNQEVNLELAKSLGIEIGRRRTGGGTIYFNKEQIGWEIVASLKDFNIKNYEELSQYMCEKVAKALSKFGVDAKYRPRNDIEINGKKISGTGGVLQEGAFLYQGTILIDFDPDKMASLLKIPYEKLKDKNISSAKERVTSLKQELNFTPTFEEIAKAIKDVFKEFGLEDGSLTEEEELMLEKVSKELNSKEWVFANDNVDKLIDIKTIRTKAGTFKIGFKIDKTKKLLEYIVINGDFFATPPSAIKDLESYLKFSYIDEIPQRIREFFSKNNVNISFMTYEDLTNLILKALNE
ncbi:lipoate--protein ligase family protein [Hydrogenobaculum acidophilum]